MNGRLHQIFEITPIPRKSSDTARHSADLVQKAIETLLPLTQPTNARRCDVPACVVELLQQCLSKLLSLEVTPTPPPKVVANSQHNNQGRNEIEYPGVGWSAQRVHALRKKVDQDKDMPYLDNQGVCARFRRS